MTNIKEMDQWSDEEILLRESLYDEIYTIIDNSKETINTTDTLQKLTDEYSRKRELTGYISALKDNNIPIPKNLIDELQTYELLSPPRQLIEGNE